MKKIVQVIMIGMITGLMNCSKDIAPCTQAVAQATIDAVPKTQLTTDIGRISNYLTANSITATEDPSGLRYVITTLGAGKTPCLQSAITVNYIGKTLMANGTLNPTAFDASTSPVTFNLQGLILGWQIGFLKLPSGSSATLYIPSGLAYGATARTGMPANSVLVFNVELVSFN